jgi:HEAT repeat protein
MTTRVLFHRSAVGVLAVGLFGLVLAGGLEAAGKAEEAKKFTEQLKTTKDAKKKVEAIEELGKLGMIQRSLAEDAFPDIKKALDDKEPMVRKAAAEAYGKLDPDPKEAVPKLTKMLKEDKEESVKVGAANGLAAMRSAAKEALPELRKIAKDLKDDKKSKLGKAAQDASRSITERK